MKRLLFLLFLLITSTVWGYMGIGFMGGSPPVSGGNNFSSDANCSALWKFESGALTTDSKGGNTLTNNNTVVENTSEYKEGFCSADFERNNSEYFSITDANLDAGYPLKNGDTNKKISVCGWFRLESLDTADLCIYGKYNTTGKRSFLIFADAGNNKLHLYVGYNSGDSYNEYVHASVLSVGIWYHYGVTWQDSDKSYRIRMWDDNASAILGSDLTGTGINNINVEDGEVTIGSRGDPNRYWDGELDEVIVFKDILSVAEIDKIRGGVYP